MAVQVFEGSVKDSTLTAPQFGLLSTPAHRSPIPLGKRGKE